MKKWLLFYYLVNKIFWAYLYHSLIFGCIFAGEMNPAVLKLGNAPGPNGGEALRRQLFRGERRVLEQGIDGK